MKFLEKIQIDMHDLNNLQILTMAFKESLRLYSPVLGIPRTNIQDVVIEGKTVPAGTLFNLSLTAVQRNEKMWKDPLQYIPERFSPSSGNVEAIAKGFCPFSLGQRK